MRRWYLDRGCRQLYCVRKRMNPAGFSAARPAATRAWPPTPTPRGPRLSSTRRRHREAALELPGTGREEAELPLWCVARARCGYPGPVQAVPTSNWRHEMNDDHSKSVPMQKIRQKFILGCGNAAFHKQVQWSRLPNVTCQSGCQFQGRDRLTRDPPGAVLSASASSFVVLPRPLAGTAAEQRERARMGDIALCMPATRAPLRHRSTA